MIPDEPIDLRRHSMAVWLKDGQVAVDTHLGSEICDAMDYPRGTCGGHVITPARAREMAAQLIEAATIVESGEVTAPPEAQPGVMHERDGVTTIEVVIEGRTKDAAAHAIHMIARQLVESTPELECTVTELLQHATGRARKAQTH